MTPFRKDKMKSVDSKHELECSLRKNRKVLALFLSSWCPFCQSFLPFFERRVGGEGFDEVLHVVLDDYENPLWEVYSIEAVPTVVLFERGNESKRLDGRLGRGLSEQQLVEWLHDV